MLVNSVLIEYLQKKGLTPQFLPDREVKTYSWEELLACHPDAQRCVAELLDETFCATQDELDSVCIPNLAPNKDESDYEYDTRLASYLEFNYFPAKAASSVGSGSRQVVMWVCSNPFIEALDEHSSSLFVIVPPSIINGVLRGNKFDSSALAPYNESESIDAWINRLIAAVYAKGAADVEITSHTSAMKVRLKTMGVWGEWVSSVPLIQRGPLLRALCASATPSLDYESGSDHDFKLEKRIHGVDTSWRGSITPAALGDSVTLRMLPGIGRVPLLGELGYNDQAVELLRSAKSRRDGLVLVTGSTGHGKTTTLYALITEMRNENRKVFTVEHPVELVIPGTIQKPVMDSENIESKYRVTFASAIRTALRHAPDVLVVGETRDSETAQTAVSASRTGHLTFTTLHTTNVKTSVKRMLDLGIDATNLADTLTLVVSQTLVRKLCPCCKTHSNGIFKRNPEGCSHCNGFGYLGRTAVYEMASLDDEARESIIDGTLDKHFQRLERIGRYISKRTIAQDLLFDGLVDQVDVEDFLHV